nr:hypothetical protein [Tanacetum cinerariifolium]
ATSQSKRWNHKSNELNSRFVALVAAAATPSFIWVLLSAGTFLLSKNTHSVKHTHTHKKGLLSVCMLLVT